MKPAKWLTFRRTYSLCCRNKGIPDKITAELMGHTNVRTTLDVHTQVIPATRHVAAERVGSELIANWSQMKEAGHLARPVNTEAGEGYGMGATGRNLRHNPSSFHKSQMAEDTGPSSLF